MAWPAETSSYCGWKEVHVRNEKGRKVVHYYLKRRDGTADLAVVGREKNSRRMSYRYALETNGSVLFKLNTRGDVVDWLNSVVSDVLPQEANIPTAPASTRTATGLNHDTLKDAHYPEQVHSKNFSWMGTPWICKKRRKHYPSFCRNGVRVSVNDFVYVLAEQNKRLIAYLEDIYEDSKGSKMVLVRWFHKTDEVGIVLPHNVNDREIFFSLCLQDINIECIDGLATVLSLQHYEKFQKEFMHGQPVVFFCRKLYEDDVIKPYNIAQLKGYWRQEMLRYLNVTASKSGEGAQEPSNELGIGAAGVNCGEVRLRKRRRSSPVESLNTSLANGLQVDCKGSLDCVNLDAWPAPKTQEEAKPSSSQYIKKGSFVEILSQDSGIRGCWFKALIIKKHKDKVKVQYQDIQDAEDESKKLEEWIVTSRIAAADHFGVRIPGRKMIRPPLETCKANNLCAAVVGMPVDVWWFHGWWEGIVVRKVSEEKFEVYLPGEKKTSVFHLSDLRQSQEWLGDEWVNMKPRSDLVSSVLSSVETKHTTVKIDEKSAQVGAGNIGASLKGESELTDSLPVVMTKKDSVLQSVPDLLKDVLVSDLKWKTSGKRKRSSGCCSQKLVGLSECFTKNSSLVTKSRGGDRSMAPDSFKVDCENCKFMGDSLFGSSVAPAALTSLVMSR
ncbi:PREDICTED: uncharacterized protein LOC104821945 [Tarenaya hassleriana]|uniref:uncharacterized protein LOC104821945 n=1 Tax=Tarenaya hassleriana TaxID=28532 RepID=UPI00053C6C69|nr:PREDICTED: uncharacterized protein LOC104821945 [Tarenaya hassleriana]